MEAYQVLSKTHSRLNYDMSLRGIHKVNYVHKDIYHEPWRDQSTSYTEDKPYYGVKGIKKLANWKVVMACVIFCAAGVMLQAIAISKSVTFKREVMKERSAIYTENLRKAREDAQKYGNEEQLKRLSMKMRTSPYDEVKPEM